MGEEGVSDTPKDDFLERRRAARQHIDMELEDGETLAERHAFFDAVYEHAGHDPAAVPWAELRPRAALLDWLGHLDPARKQGRAIDVACGLGDNAEALAAAGFDTVAFDFAERAIEWARERFPESAVDYRVADMFDPPSEWIEAFDVVHECYTVQSLPGHLREIAPAAIARLVKPGGRLLLIARFREEGSEASGPPWPLMPSEVALFEEAGLRTVWRDHYDVVRPDRAIPHVVAEFEKP